MTVAAEAYIEGYTAQVAGQPRVVPQTLLLVGGDEVGSDRSVARAWYSGWDQANLEERFGDV